MRFNCSTACCLAAGSLTTTLALPLSTSTMNCMSPQAMKLVLHKAAISKCQEWHWTPAAYALASIPPQPTFVYSPPQPSVAVPSISYSFTDLPTATSTTQAQADLSYTPAREKFGSRAMLVLFGVIGIVILVVTVWAVIAQRKRRRPFACFGGCAGHKKDAAITRSGSVESDLPLMGAGHHYDRRPVSMQPQLFPMPAPQRPQPVQYQIPRQPDAEPEWARHF
jgi:hypothetical protein